MHEDRLHALGGDVSVAATRGLSVLSHQPGTQSVAVCEATQIIAAANGRFVDLYGLSGGSSPLRLTFLTQIALDDYALYLPVTSNQAHHSSSDNSQVIVATCLSFPIPGVLLVGAASISSQAPDPNSEMSRTRHSTVQSSATSSTSTMVLGFRLYASRSVQYAPPMVDGAPERPCPPPVQVHFSFLEPIVGTAEGAIRTFQPCRQVMTPDSGSVVMLFDDCSAFGVLMWKERFSDRRVCLAELKQRPEALVAAAVSSSGHVLVLADTASRMSCLDCSRLAWGNDPPSQSVEGRRLQLGVCSHSGVVARDNPLDEVRLVYSTGGVDSGSSTTSIRWWRCGAGAGGSNFILAGKRDGSLSVFQVVEGHSDKGPGTMGLKLIQMYPGLSSGKHDAIRNISEPSKATTFAESSSPNTEWFEFCTISDMRWRVWRVKIGRTGKNPQRGTCMGWPSLKESLGFPAFSFMTKGVKGVAVLSGSTQFSRSVAKAFTVANPGETAQHPITLMLAEGRLQFIGRLAKTPSADQYFLESASEGNSVQENDQRKCDTEDALEETNTEGADPKLGNDTDERLPRAAMTIQEKYKLPPMEWKARTATSSTSSNQKETVNALGTARIGRAEYDERMASVSQRVGNLCMTLKTMRVSFGLFSQDVQQHMNTITEQLEEMSRRAVADQAR